MLCTTNCDLPVECSFLLEAETPQRSLPTASVSAGIPDAPYVPMNICKQPFVFLAHPPERSTSFRKKSLETHLITFNERCSALLDWSCFSYAC